MIKKLITGGAVAAALFGVTALPVLADTLGDIIARGKVVGGVKADFPPWGMRDAAGKLVGLEHDMIADFARRLSAVAGKPIAVEKVVVVASNRMQFLVQGETDLFIAPCPTSLTGATSSVSFGPAIIRRASPFSRTGTPVSTVGIR